MSGRNGSSSSGPKYQRVATADLDLERSLPEGHSEDSETEQERERERDGYREREREYRPSAEIFEHLRDFRKKNRKSLWIAIMIALSIVLFLYWAVL
jgi:hypothetical protein